MSTPLLTVQNLRKLYSRGTGSVGLDGVSFSVAAGETVALVGESGSGKTTCARLLTRLIEAEGGAVQFGGVDWLAMRGEALRHARGRLQMVFQDPIAAFNPRASLRRLLSDPFRLQGLGRQEIAARVRDAFQEVGLPDTLLDRLPHEVSGGQRQRVAIARALASKPELLILDEPVSALDVSVRAQILNLLRRLQRDRGCGYLFISHDLAVVRAIADRILVLHQGRIVEEGDTETVLADPRHPYTQSLIAAVPRLIEPGRTHHDG
ncbi:ATP-binding cassette domain-containing protein [Lacibacterium aquatile]|uniref:ATP-binding cassette domain-containing protein n=1 Tax=Lacibacterium aquatile TaxID=1168082 RepID=A0ABW5DTH8_9PROT